IRSWSAVNQSAFPNALPANPRAAAAATTAVEYGLARSAGSSATSPKSTKPVASGRRGLNRSAAAAPTSEPTPAHVTIAPQLDAPPRERCATNGPSTNSGPSARFQIEKYTMLVHTHVLLVTSRQPARNSA